MNSITKNETLENIGRRIDEAIDISKNIKNFKEGWEKLKEIQNELKEFETTKEIKDQLWLPLNESFERIKKREKEYFKKLKEKQNENYNKLKPLVDNATIMVNENKNLREVWSELISVQKMFKGLSLPREKHQALWDTMQENFNVLKKKEEELYELQKDNWNENYSRLLKKVEEAKEIAENSTYFKEAWGKINEIKSIFTSVKTDKVRESELLNELQKSISKLKKRQEERKVEIEKIKEAGFDKLNKLCNRALNEANTNKNLKELFNRLKTWQKDIFSASRYLDTQEEKDILKSKINEAFTIYKVRQEEFHKNKKEEWLIKQKDFLEKIKEKKERLFTVTIPKIKKSIEHSKEYLIKIKAELSELEETEENKKKFNFLSNKIEKVKDEIIEKENSIIDINKKIEDIEKTIIDVESKINNDKP